MRNYALFTAESHAMSRTPVDRVKALVKNWMSRRKVRRLAELDDFILRDIGISRDEIDRLSYLSLDTDPATELIRLRRRGGASFWSI